MELIAMSNERVRDYPRTREGHRLIVLANFSEESQLVEGNKLRSAGLERFFQDVLDEKQYAAAKSLVLEP